MSNDTGGDKRPSPESLLKLAQAEEAGAGQGKLKIFLGYAAGVGKTFAMLEAAWHRRLDDHAVVAAYVESHGRFETDSILSGLEIIPKLQIDYQGVRLSEMDLDAVLARKPEIALVDELAHSNAPGCRHEKRWQDIEELLAAGIDVYTTVNIQHFESLNDIVAQITGVTVRETVPDRLLDRASEIRLVDIPPEELLQRLREGKVYLPQQAAWAAEKFFQPGNLIALRELAMRRAAARVDEQMRAYMEERDIPGPWAAGERLLVCISGSPYGERLIRTARRLADELKVPWITLYIETPGIGRELQENRRRVWRDLRLAESLGADVATVTATAVADAVLDYAGRHNVTRIVIGKPTRPRWREVLRLPVVDQIIRKSGMIDVHVVSIDPSGQQPARPKPVTSAPAPRSGYLLAAGLVAAATLLCEGLRSFIAPTNMVMIYLLAVVVAAMRLGVRAANLAALLGVLAFDFFFVPPRLTLAVADSEYLITFAAFLAVGVVISSLVARVGERAAAVREREMQTASLYYLSRDLAAAAAIEDVLAAVVKNSGATLDARIALFLPERERLEVKAASPDLVIDAKEAAVADWAFRNRQAAGCGTETLASAGLLYLPLQAAGNHFGVCGVRLTDASDYHSPRVRRLLDAFVIQAALAMERVALARQAEQAQILSARENLERALLNSISHDLRTPLVTIAGALGALRDEEPHLGVAARRELVAAAWEETERLNRFVGNLLDMTRLEAGELQLKRQPCEVQDLVGCALAALEQRLGTRAIALRVPAELPLIGIDLALMSQVLVNLLDNSLKYAPPEEPIEITAVGDNGMVAISVADRGPGVPEHDLQRIFDKFYRIPVPEGTRGTGLGLSICKGIVEAHGGTIGAANRAGGGLVVTVRLAPAVKEDG